MGDGLQDGLGWHTLLDKVIRGEKFLIGLVRPSHAALTAGSEQPRVQDLPHIVVTRGERRKVPIFPRAHERGDCNVFVRRLGLGTIPDRKAMSERGGNGDSACDAQPLTGVELTLPPCFAPAHILFVTKCKTALVIQISGAGWETPVTLVGGDEHFQGQGLDGKSDGLGAE